MAAQFLTRRRLMLGGAAVAVLGFLFAISFQVPATTRLSVTLAPRVPAELAPELGVKAYPRDPLAVIPSVGPGASLDMHFRLKPLLGEVTLDPPAPVAIPGGVALTLVDPWLSLGARQATEVALGLRGTGGASSTIELAFHVRDARAEGPLATPCRSGAQRLRPQREWPAAAPGHAVAHAEVDICRGSESALQVDTSPLAFLVPDAAWDELFTRPPAGGGALPYSNRRAAHGLDGERVPFAGLDLRYTVEDELDGTPYPRPEALAVTAKVVEADRLVDVDAPCRDWDARLGKRCWAALTALPAGRCAAAWPVEVDGEARVLHVDFTGAPVPDCKLLLGLASAGSDDVHAMLFDLQASPAAGADAAR